MLDINTINLEKLKDISRYNSYYSESFIKSLNKEVAKNHLNISNKPYYISYYNIINRTASLLHKLNLTNPLEYCIAYEYLLWYGYFSLNHQLIFSIKNRINKLSLTGADIMLGKSVCLNNAEMLTNLLNTLGIKSYTFACDLKGNLDTIEYRPNIERKQVKESLLNQTLTKLLSLSPIRRGNHAITALTYQDNFIFCDPTSLAFLNYSDFLKIRYVGSNIEVDLKPWLTAILSKINKNELDYIVYHSLTPKKLITTSEVKKITEEILSLCQDNKPLLETFYMSNKKDIDIISKTLKR